MTIPQTIRVPERGNSDVASATWKELSRSSQFWGLVERGIVSVEQQRSGDARLTGGCYVGRARVTDGLVLELHEKVSGSLASLLRFASGADFRIERLPSPTSDLGPLIGLLVAQFADVVRAYAARGRMFEYRRIARLGSLIGGRLDITRTVRVWGRGLRHLAAFEKDVVSFDVPVNRSVLAALREIERIGAVIPLPPTVVSRVRAMAILFADCRTAEVLFAKRVDAARRADMLASAATDELTGDMLALAAVILSNESFEEGSVSTRTAPRSWFLNLETLFEKAVRRELARALRSTATVTSGRAAPLPIFPAKPEKFRANPDLVIRTAGDGKTYIGDVKYKLWDGVATAGDVYQLLVHAAAFGSMNAFLVFPLDRYEATVVGDAVTGAAVRLFAIDLREMSAQIEQLLRDMAVTTWAQETILTAGVLA